MCEVLHKDTIKPEILPHLSVSKHTRIRDKKTL